MSPEAFFTLIIWTCAAAALATSLFGLWFASLLATIWIIKAKQ